MQCFLLIHPDPTLRYRDGDMVHLFHVIAPGQYVVLSSDLGVDEVVENSEETSRRTEHANKFLTTQFVPKLAEKKVQGRPQLHPCLFSPIADVLLPNYIVLIFSSDPVPN